MRKKIANKKIWKILSRIEHFVFVLYEFNEGVCFSFGAGAVAVQFADDFYVRRKYPVIRVFRMMWRITHAIQLRAHRAKATVSMKNNLWQCHTLTDAWNYLLSLLCYKYVEQSFSHNCDNTHHINVCMSVPDEYKFCISVLVVVFCGVSCVLN